MKNFVKSVTIVTLFSIITRVLGFFFRIFLSRKLGAEGLGIFQIAASVIGIFLTLVSSGLPLTTAKLVSKYNSSNDFKRKNTLVTSALIIGFVISILTGIIILALKGFWNIIISEKRAVEIILVLIPSIIFSALYAIFRGALWGEGDYFACGITELFEQVVRFILTAILLKNIADYFWSAKYSAVAFNFTCLASALFALMFYLKRGRFKFNKGEYKSVLKSATPITGVRLANSLVQPLTAMIIPFMLIVAGYSTADATASYGVIMGMTMPLLYVPMTITGSISMVLIPSISALLQKGDHEKIKKNIITCLNVTLFLSAIFVPLYIAVGNKIGIILYKNALSGTLLQIASICLIPISMCNLTGSILNALNLEVKSFKNYFIGSSFLIICLLALTPFLKISAVIVAYFVSMSLISILNIQKINKTLNIEYHLWKETFKYTLIIIPSSLIGSFVGNICSQIFGNFISCALGGGISILFILILCQTFKFFNIKNIINLVKKRTTI